MKRPADGHNHFYVDESGDSVFYDRKGRLIVGTPGCSPLLILGFIETCEPESIRRAVLKLHAEVMAEPVFQGVPSLERTRLGFHATDDIPEIRYLVFRMLRDLNFKAQFVVARKLKKVFDSEFKRDCNRFYDSLVSRLFGNALHRYQCNTIVYATRGSSTRREQMERAIEVSRERFERRWGKAVNTVIDVVPHTPGGEPCLQVVDYMLWAVQRAYVNREMRFFSAVEDKVSLLVDCYDWANSAGSRNWYSRRNPFHIEKATPLQLGS